MRILFFILFLSCVAKAGDVSLSEEILQTDVQLSHEVAAPSDFVLVLIDISKETGARDIRRDLITEIVRNRLRNVGIRNTVYEGDFLNDLRATKIRESHIAAPKLVIEVVVGLDDSRFAYSSDCALSLVEPKVQRGRVTSQRTWYKRQNLKGMSFQDSEDSLVQYIQKELKAFLPKYQASNAKRKSVVKGKLSSGNFEQRSEALHYSLSWNDPDNRRNRFLFGVSAGTPALLNLHLGFWGSRAVPAVFGVSGMYFGRDHRGFQLDAGWAFDNSGTLKQVIGVTGALFAESKEIRTEEKDVFGRPTATTSELIHALRPYVGPSYVLDWNDFRLQVGVGIRATEEANSKFRGMIQLGYTPPVRFW